MAEQSHNSGLQHSSASLLSSQTPEGSSTQQETYDDKHQSKGLRKPAWAIYNSVVVISGVAPVVVIIVWLALTRENGGVFTTFAGEKIGGKFSQSQAKAVDVVCSAVLAPLFMALLNYFGSGVPGSLLSTSTIPQTMPGCHYLQSWLRATRPVAAMT